jgi:hypothetical protein
MEGKRTGGPAPYGLEDNGAGGLKHGDRKKVRTVKWIFKQFVTELNSMNAIADELNQKTTPSPRGGMWSSASVKHILKQRAYVGDFAFGAEQGAGRFHIMDDNGEVVANGSPGERKVREPIFTAENVYKPLVDRPLFNRAQKLLAERASDRSLRNRSGNYPLTGVLVCDHCKRPMTGCRPNSGKYVVYRCNSYSKHGKSACKKYQIRQDVILPFAMRLLGEEIAEIATLLTQPPDDLLIAPQIRAEKRLQLEGERVDLNYKVDVGRKNLLLVEDARNRKMLDEELGTMHDRLEEIDKLLAEKRGTEEYTREDLKALTDWWVEFSGTPDKNGQAVSVPVSSEVNMKLAGGLLQDPYSEESAILVDPLKVNAALRDVGTKIELRWNTTKVKSRNRHTLSRGRFRLGQKSGNIPEGVLGSTACRLQGLFLRCPSVLFHDILIRTSLSLDELRRWVVDKKRICLLEENCRFSCCSDLIQGENWFRPHQTKWHPLLLPRPVGTVTIYNTAFQATPCRSLSGISAIRQ